MLERSGRAAFDHTLHAGAASTRMQWYFRESTELPVAVQRWELPPGGSEGLHSHPGGDTPLEELYILVAGEAVMRVDDDIHPMAPGDAVLAPVGSEHDLRNTGPGPAVLIVVWGPPGNGPSWTGFTTWQKSRAAAEQPPPPIRPADDPG